MSEVEYRDVPGFPGYRVGSDGTVWSCWTRYGQKRKMTALWRRLKPKCRNNTYGYLGVTLCRNGLHKDFMIGVLVLTVFVEPRPEGMHCCHYPDPDPSNNNLTNLRWGTPKENSQDMVKLGRSSRGSRRPKSKLKESDIPGIRKRLRDGESQYSIAKDHGVTQAIISSVKLKKTWKHVPEGEEDMLVLSRKLGEKVYIGTDVVITVVDIDRGKIRLGIEAPREMPIYRQEVLPVDFNQTKQEDADEAV